MADPAGIDRRPRARRTDTTDPRRSREQAFKILFQSDVRRVAAVEVLDHLAEDERARTILDGDDQPRLPAEVDGFTRTLVLGVTEQISTIDALIGRFARRWQVSRMPAVDRTVLRLATYELLHEPTPPAVVIDEAIGLAKSLSTDDSGRYVNGVLESIRKDLASHADDGSEGGGPVEDGSGGGDLVEDGSEDVDAGGTRTDSV